LGSYKSSRQGFSGAKGSRLSSICRGPPRYLFEQLFAVPARACEVGFRDRSIVDPKEPYVATHRELPLRFADSVESVAPGQGNGFAR
jgi:hypothetical protein